jgi:hypothetical protein
VRSYSVIHDRSELTRGTAQHLIDRVQYAVTTRFTL